jgi:fatty-acyl-CoA synthase
VVSTVSSIAAQLIPASATDPDRVAVVCESGATLSYGELGDRAARLAGALRSRGLHTGDVVAVLADNSPTYLEMVWACRIAGLYYVVLNTHLGADEIGFIVTDSGAGAVLASAALPVVAELRADLVPGVGTWLLLDATDTGSWPGWEDYEAVVGAAHPLDGECEYEGDLLQYSSGTTGRPKGIKRALRLAPKTPGDDAYTFLVSLIGITDRSVYLSPAPLYHSAPITWTMAVLRLGGTVVLMRKFEPVAALSLIEQHRVTHAQFVPTMFTRMLKLPEADRAHDVSSLEGVVHAAAPCPVDIKRRMIDWWGPIVAEYWSSSEGAGFTFISAAEWLDHPGSVGRSLLGPLHICDADGRELPIGAEGVIWAEAPEFSYLNDADKDAETTSTQGWRTVGDVGRLDEEGYLYLTDRASFMIISGGVNIYPQEAENALVEHPRVYDAAVVGIPDEDLGEVAVAVVQPLDPADAGPELAAVLSAWCEQRLARYKCPRRFEFVAELPRSDTGKLYKRQIREQIAGRS